jgi:hypothetical protein
MDEKWILMVHIDETYDKLYVVGVPSMDERRYSGFSWMKYSLKILGWISVVDEHKVDEPY